MKIEIKNFGPISEFSYELENDYFLIVGENNIGKSYAISLIYNILKILTSIQSNYFYYHDYGQRESDEITKWLKEIEKQISQSNSSADIDVTASIGRHIHLMFERLYLPALRESLYGTFSEIANLKSRYSDEPLLITISGSNVRASITIDKDRLKLSEIEIINKRSISIRKVRTNRSTKDFGDKIVVYYAEEYPERFERNYIGLVSNFVLSIASEVGSKVSDIHYLPASRSGLYQALSAFGQIVAELAKNRTMLTKKIELPGISEPLSDYFLKLSEARVVPASEVSTPYLAVAKIIEDEILLGTVDIDTKTKKIMFSQPEIGLKLDLSATSSMVSEISPIATYLKYVLPRAEIAGKRRYGPSERKQIVFIEEPEAHLHPKVQVALMRVFAKLVATTNTKIIMTSHSNFVFNKLSNLIIDKSIDAEKFTAVMFKKGNAGSTCDVLKVTEFGISDENFVDVGESLYVERVNLIESIGEN